MHATQRGAAEATTELHGAAAASVGSVVGAGGDAKSLLKGLAAGGGAGGFKSPSRLLASLRGRTPTSSKSSRKQQAL